MAQIINLKSFKDTRGELTVIEKALPFPIKRVYYIYNLNSQERGFHRHKETVQALICVSGSCDVFCQSKKSKTNKFELKNPKQCLIIDPQDYHWMTNFSPKTIILVLASKLYDKNDYVDEAYE